MKKAAKSAPKKINVAAADPAASWRGITMKIRRF